jgi:hypothetical protein
MTELSNYERASVVEAYECGDKIADIAAKFGIAETHVSSIIKAAAYRASASRREPNGLTFRSLRRAFNSGWVPPQPTEKAKLRHA